MRRLVTAGVFVFAVAVTSAQTPVPDLAKPPSDARHFVIQSTGGRHGESWIWTAPDGSRMGRERMNLRGQVYELDSTGRVGADGMPAAVVIRGITPQGDAAETFTVAGKTARWKSPIDSGTADYPAPAFYVAPGGPIDATAWFVDALLSRPDKTLNLLPAGQAHAAKLADTEVGSGVLRQTITLWAITGIATSPLPVWADATERFFGISLGLAWLPDAYAGEQARIEQAQSRAVAAQAPALMKALVTVPTTAVALAGVRLFEADAGRFTADQTVVVENGAITAVGPRASVRVPAGAEVIEGAGKTLIPGLWDCHMHPSAGSGAVASPCRKT